ncbi:hypothetical protein [Hoylesella nanceiensis]|jgi:hypothetical protein|uniref:hypothetical protein n=1 Tax=Hoylesella nanceiensis TaxID=425941 RepID=UPI001CB52157|nr:hypothetical protein [Hoylesella nanceiensis]MBF1440088.1 hypothetical protein [Hoylesella nanceiensis]
MSDWNLNKVSSRFRKISIGIIAGLSLLLLLLSNVFSEFNFIHGILVGAVYSIIFSTAYLESWRVVTVKAPSATTKFYLVFMALRFILGALVILSYCLLNNKREAIISFVTVFSVYYLVMMIFETSYFVIIEQKKIR